MIQRISILGLGTMGAGMAANLLKAGFEVTVYNRTAAKAEPLHKLGARKASTAAEAAAGASIVISMLADDEASRAVWNGERGALEGLEQGEKKDHGVILIESGTVSPAWIEELAGLAAQHGADLLDAPVTGSRIQAAAGQLTFLVGGSAPTLLAATPALKAMSKEIVHLGPTGSGARMKLINNFLCGVQVASLAEGLAWIEQSGLDREQALSILKAGAPGSPLLGAISDRMAQQKYDVNFLLRLMTKDLEYARQEAARSHVDLRTADVARSLFESAIEKGFGEQDMAAVIEPLRKTSKAGA
jgi:3-hydroxyisobutyrate dehydrogenase